MQFPHHDVTIYNNGTCCLIGNANDFNDDEKEFLAALVYRWPPPDGYIGGLMRVMYHGTPVTVIGMTRKEEHNNMSFRPSFVMMTDAMLEHVTDKDGNRIFYPSMAPGTSTTQ